MGPDGDDFVCPRLAAMGAVESVYSLVSALYGLSDSSSVPPADAVAVLDHTPRVDLAFGRIKPVLSNLTFESDFDDSSRGWSYEDCLDDDDCTYNVEELDQRRMLVRHIRTVSRLVDAAAETVRRVTDHARDWRPEMAKGKQQAQSSSRWTPSLECCYITLLELMGAGCAMIKKVDKEMNANMVDYAAGGMTGYHDFNASMGSTGFGEASSTVFGVESMLMDSAGWLSGFGSAGSGMDMAGASGGRKGGNSKPVALRWKLSLALRRTWSRAAPDALKIILGADGQDQSSSSLATSNVPIVDLDLFREVAPMVLRRLEWCPPNYLKFASASTSRAEGAGGKEAGGRVAIEGDYLRRTKERREGQEEGERNYDDPERETAVNDLQDASDLRDAEILVGLGDLRSSLKDYESAHAHYREALRILRFHYGNDDPLVAAVHESVGNTYRALGKYNEAGTCYDRALRSRRQSNEPDEDLNHAATVSLLKSWTTLKEETGEIDEAINTLGYCRDLQLKKLEQMRNADESCQGEGGGQGKMGKRTKEKVVASDGITLAQVADTIQRRGSLSMESGRVDATLADFTEVLRLRREEDGPDSPLVGDALRTLGLLRFRSHDTKEALEFMWEALRVRKIAAVEEEKEGGAGAVEGPPPRGGLPGHIGYDKPRDGRP